MKILTTIFKFGIAEAFARGANILLVLLLPIIVDVETFGIISILIAIESLLSAIITFQQPDIYIRFYTTVDNRKIQLYQSSTLVIALSGLFTIIIIAFSLLIPNLTNFAFPHWYILLIFIGSMLQSNIVMYISHLRVKENIGGYSFYRLLLQLTKFILTIIIAVVFRTAIAFILGFLISNVLASIVLIGNKLQIVKLVIEKFNFAKLTSSDLFKQNLRIGIPLGISSLITSIYSVIDRFLLQYFLNIEDVGIYNFAFSQGSASFFLITILTLALLPYIYESGEYDLQTRKRLMQYLGIGLLCIFASTIFVYFALFPLLLTTVSSQYEQGRLIILFASGTIVAQLLQLFCRYSLMTLKKVNITTVAILISLIAKTGLNVILIPSQGINGAGISAVISQFVSSIIMLIGLFFIRTNLKNNIYNENISES